MKVLVVYLGKASHGNFAHSIQSGVWGFKPNMQPEESFGPGDVLLFASGYTGANIRLPEEQWLPHNVTMIATAQIETPISIESTFHWPDETATNKLLYPKRFKFSQLRRKDGQFPLNDAAFFPREISLAIRKAAIGGEGANRGSHGVARMAEQRRKDTSNSALSTTKPLSTASEAATERN